MNIIKHQKRLWQGLAGLAITALVWQIASLTPSAFAAIATVDVSVSPTTINSGTTQQFDITVTNHASASTSIDAVIVTKTHDFVISTSGIECPASWVLVTSSDESFLCATEDTALDIEPGSSTHIVFTATAPTVTSDTSSFWNLYFQDSGENEYEDPNVVLTILAATTTATTTPPTTSTTTPPTTSTTTPPTATTTAATSTPPAPTQSSSSGGGGSSRPADNAPSGSVLGAFTETPPEFIGVPGPVVTTPAPMVLGAFSPGIPSTGVDGPIRQNATLVAIGLAIIALELSYLSKKRSTIQR